MVGRGGVEPPSVGSEPTVLSVELTTLEYSEKESNLHQLIRSQ